MIPKDLNKLQELLRKAWSLGSSTNPDYWTPGNPACGQCVATFQLVKKDYYGGETLGGKVKAPGYMYVDRLNHFWNRLPDGREIDFTKEQFPEGTVIVGSEPVRDSFFAKFPEAVKAYAVLRLAIEDLLEPKQRKIRVFTVGNSKIGPKALVFNLPPIETCLPSEWCRKNCYALKGRHIWLSVKQSQQIKLELSRRPDFVELAVAELKRSQCQYVCLHSSGDFYSVEYVEKWIEIVKRCPEKLFGTTTKRMGLRGVLQELDSLPNMIVRESLDPSRPRPSGFLPTVTVIERTPLDYINQELFFCRNDCVPCNYTCWKERVSIKVKPL